MISRIAKGFIVFIVIDIRILLDISFVPALHILCIKNAFAPSGWKAGLTRWLVILYDVHVFKAPPCFQFQPVCNVILLGRQYYIQFNHTTVTSLLDKLGFRFLRRSTVMITGLV